MKGRGFCRRWFGSLRFLLALGAYVKGLNMLQRRGTREAKSNFDTRSVREGMWKELVSATDWNKLVRVVLESERQAAGELLLVVL